MLRELLRNLDCYCGAAVGRFVWRASLVFDLGVIEADAQLLTLQKRFVNNMQAA